MLFYKSFFINLSILVTCSYLFNLVYKQLFAKADWRLRQTAMVVIFILAGWLSMVFSVRTDGYALFDLRAVPIIFAALVFRDPRLLLVIGLGIAAFRYAVTGLTSTAVTGSINILMLGIVGALLVALFNRKHWRYRWKAGLAIFIINTVQVSGIALFGAVPTSLYLYEIAPFTYPTSLIVSTFFVFIMRDFYKEQRRGEELRHKNTILKKQAKELKSAKEELELKTLQLRQSAKFKSEFIATMSHELKTPLNSILLMSELIKDAEEEECAKNAKAAAQIHEAGTELLRIIEDILDLSKLEAGKMEPVSELVSPQDLGQLVAYQHQELVAHKKGLQIVLEHAPDTPEAIMTDMFRLNQLLRILLHQVSAYAEEGSILLRIEPDQDQDGILFRIASCHAVLPQAHRELLQQAIYTDRPELLQAVGIGGLGLSVCLRLATLLGGRLDFEISAEGKDSFVLRLPVDPAARLALAQTVPS